jgi:hypothetical protein
VKNYFFIEIHQIPAGFQWIPVCSTWNFWYPTGMGQCDILKNQYPLSVISELIDQLTGAKYFLKMDVRWGYNNI